MTRVGLDPTFLDTFYRIRASMMESAATRCDIAATFSCCSTPSTLLKYKVRGLYAAMSAILGDVFYLGATHIVDRVSTM